MTELEVQDIFSVARPVRSEGEREQEEAGTGLGPVQACECGRKLLLGREGEGPSH